MSKLIVITGITGVQGGSVATTFLQEPGWKVRGITRNPSSEKAKEWVSKGVDMVKGDADDKGSLISAFAGATAIFGLTDFWTPVNDPLTQAKLESGQKINEYAYDVEIQQGKNLADAAATVDGLEIYVMSTLPNAKKVAKGKFPHVYHVDSKPVIVEYIHNELPELAKRLSEIQLGCYMEFWKWQMPNMPRKAPDGTYTISYVNDGSKPVAFTAAAHDTGPCVRALVNSPPGKVLYANAKPINFQEYLATWCESQKVPQGGIVSTDPDKFAETIGGDIGVELRENFEWLEEALQVYEKEGTKLLSPEDLGVKMQSFREYCDNTDFSSILA